MLCSFSGCLNDTECTRYCPEHLESLYHVKIALSNLPKAGQGLFTTIELPRNTRVVQYEGKRIDLRHDHTASREMGGDYVLNYLPHRFIDAENEIEGGACRYCNDCTPENRRLKHAAGNNCKFQYDKLNDQVWLITTRCIKAGEELFVGYGSSQYWDKI